MIGLTHTSSLALSPAASRTMPCSPPRCGQPVLNPNDLHHQLRPPLTCLKSAGSAAIHPIGSLRGGADQVDASGGVGGVGDDAITERAKRRLLGRRTSSGGIISASSASSASSFGEEVKKVVAEKVVGPSGASPFVRHSRRRMALYVIVALLAAFTTVFVSLCAFHRGFRRTVQFWSGAAPIMVRYRLTKFKARRIDRCSDEEYERRMSSFHRDSAPRVVDVMIRMGGIYVKIGQVMSTLGAGFLDDAYVRALRPLQDGVPPRDISEISEIIESSTGRRMEDVFENFEERPVGAASIAQAHRATLKRPPNDATNGKGSSGGGDGAEVIVKVQYPEVARLFDADLNNLEMATRLLQPDNVDFVRALRKRHENELDFTLEADNLRECSANMRQRGVEPRLVRIPQVRNETGLCNENVLVMEYLEGISLADAIEEEQGRVARALGKKDAQELRAALAKRMREHFERGGGVAAGEGSMTSMLGGGTGGGRMRMIQAATPLAARILRAYGGARERLEDVAFHLRSAGANVARILGGKKPTTALSLTSSERRSTRTRAHVNLSRVLKTLAHVHGLQMLGDGVYNADPHPGNVLILPDGRLGLLDYGMVGRLTDDDRENVARTVVALARGDVTKTAAIYDEAGYRATWKAGDVTDEAVLHRFATFHLDRVDLSPVTVDFADGGGRRRVDVMEILRSTQERAVPDWINQARRLGGLLIGVSSQAARPMSLSREWRPIASRVLKDGAGRQERDGNRTKQLQNRL